LLAIAAGCVCLSEARALTQGLTCPMPGGNPSCGSTTTSQSSPNPATGAGNPIDLTSGNKYQQEPDIEMPGDLSIGFTRHYNSLLGEPGVLGRGWSHTYETRLSRTETPGAADARGVSGPQITLIQSDGRVIRFKPFEATATVRRYRSTPSGYGLIEEDLSAIERLRSANAAHRALTTEQLPVWTWQWSDGRTLTFNGRGLLKSIARPDGRTLKVDFDAQRRFSKVTDSFGNWLAAEYWDNAAERLQAFAGTPHATNRGGGYRGRLKTLTLSSGERIAYEYDARGNLNDVVYPDGTLRRYEYDGAGGRDLLSKIYGRDGRLFSSYEYDSSGHATRSSHPDHRDDVRVSYQWPSPKQPLGHTTVEDTTGAKTTYTWRANGPTGSPLLLTADGPGCRTCAAGNVRYEYDTNQRVTKTLRVDASGTPIELVSSSIDTLGRTRAVEISHFAAGKIQAPDWRETREYTGNNLVPSRIVRPSVVPGHEHTLQVEYNERGQPTRITEQGFQFDEPRGLLRVSQDSEATLLERVTGLTYTQTHGLSLLHSIDGPLPGAADLWTYEYDAAGRLRAVVHPQHVVERFERDTWGRITAHTGLDGVRETLEYSGDGNIQRFARGDTWMRMRYDDAGRISQVVDSLGQQLTLTRDEAGELIQIGDAAGNRIRWSYGERGDVRDLVLLNPDGSLSQRGHPDTARSDVGATDLDASIPNAAMLSSVARALPDEVAAAIPGLHGNPQAGTAEPPVEGTTEAHATPVGVRTVYDAERRATTYVYDDFGRLTAEHSPVSGTTRFRWDEADHLIERLAADDTVTRISRDALGRAIRIRAGPEDGRIEWGAANRPTRVTFRAGEERFDYDTQARLTAHVLRVDGKEFRISYEFDSLGRTFRKHLPDGSVLRYLYNGELHPKPGVLAGIYKEGLVDRPIITDLNAPDERFADRGFTFGNGLSQRQVLDVDGNLLSDGNPKVGQSHLDWSRKTGSPATYTRTGLVGDQAPADSILPLSTRIASSVTELGEREGSQRTRAERADANSYFVSAPHIDARGQQVEDSQRRYEWDALGRLTRVFKREAAGFIKVSSSGHSEPASRMIAEYRYNLFGERISKLTHGAQGAKLTYFVWDGAELAAEIDQDGKVLRDYVYLDGRPVALLAGRAIDFIHTDHRMAPVAVTDSSRRIVWQADIHDYGAADVLASSTLDLPLRASNQYFDAETGLHYNVYRYLDAKRGRYLSPDPMGLAAGPDLYQFALGRPHEFTDPLGLQATPTKDWSTASLNDKLIEIIKRAVPLVPPDIGAALQQMVQPSNLAAMTVIFAVFTGLQATPIGWIADAAILGYSAWMFGSGLNLLIDAFIQLKADANAAKCDPDLTAAAKKMAAAFVTGSGQVAGGIAGVWGVKSSGGFTRIANGIRTLIDYAKSAWRGSEGTLVLEGAAGAAPLKPPLIKGLGGTATLGETGVQWGKGIQGQGNPYENWVQTQLPKGTLQTPPTYPVVDHIDLGTGLVTSTKTLDTQTPSVLNNPAQIYGRLKGYIDQLEAFPQNGSVSRSGFTIKSSQIKAKSIQLGIPYTTNAAEWAQIKAAIDYAQSLGIQLVVTVIAP
jgi:RHS repeat-associated protein